MNNLRIYTTSGLVIDAYSCINADFLMDLYMVHRPEGKQKYQHKVLVDQEGAGIKIFGEMIGTDHVLISFNHIELMHEF